MAFEGLFQSLAQLLIGSFIPGNDVGRALAYLGFGIAARGAVFATSAVALAFTGRILAALVPTSVAPQGAPGTRSFAATLGVTGIAVVLLSIAFRVPRGPIEVLMIPAIITLIGLAWLTLGSTFVAKQSAEVSTTLPAVFTPAAMLVVLLIFFQAVLRPGVRF